MIDYLAKLATLFELKTFSFLKKSMIKLAEEVPLASNNFIKALRYYLNKDIDPDVLGQWLKNNKNILGDLPEKTGWHFEGYFLELAEGDQLTRLVSFMDEDRAQEDLKISSSSYLQGISPIPDLYLLQGKYVNDTSYEYDASLLVKDPELAHDAFIVIALAYVAHTYDKNKIKEFIKQNLTKLNEIKKFFYGTPQYLGGGADGVAFAISQDKVLKIFKDTYSFKQAQEAMIRLHKHPALAKTEAMIYDVGEFTPTKLIDRPLYFYIIEKMKTAMSLEKNIKNSVATLISDIQIIGRKYLKDPKISPLKEDMKNPSLHADLKKKLQPYIEQIISILEMEQSHNINIISNNLELKDNWLPLLVEEILVKLLSGRTDLHIGNIGITHYGEFRYFDPSFLNDI